MKKNANWQVNLFKWIDNNKNRSFVWGSWDCCKATNSAIKAMTDDSLIPSELEWDSELTAKKAIKNYGGNLLGAMEKACSIDGIEEVGLRSLAVGDITVYEKDGAQLVGICNGFKVLGVGDDGFDPQPNDVAIKAWRIAHG